MTEKDKSASKDKSKSESKPRTRATKTTATKAAAKPASRSKSTAAAARKPAESAKPKLKETAAATRTRTRRIKPKSGAEPVLEAESAAGVADEPAPTFESLVQDMSERTPVLPAFDQPTGEEDPGASALAEWAALGAEEERRRAAAPRSRVQPPKPATPSKPATPEPAHAELLDIPAWPELSDDAPAVVIPTPPRPSRPAQSVPPPPPRKTAEPATWPGPDEDEPLSSRSFEPDFEPDDQDTEIADESEPAGEGDAATAASESTEEQPTKSRRRRRRRRGRNRKPAEDQAETDPGQRSPQPGQRSPELGQRSAQPGQRSSEPKPAPAKHAPGKPAHQDRRDRPERVDRQPHAPRTAHAGRPAPVSDEIEEGLEAPDLVEEVWEPDIQDEDTEAVPAPDEKNGRLMLINVAEGEECRIAILHQKRLEELFIERASAESHVGNIYKGRVTNVEPSIQAAFVDFGLPKNGFLHISDLQPQYFPGGMKTVEEVGRKTPRRDRPPIQKCLRRGQEIIVQIIKEGIGTKGPTLTTYISIPGRYLVMMPGMNRLGVSRRIEDDGARRKMRKILDELNLPKEMGFILRTAGLDRTKRELQQDLLYLQRLWKVVARRIKGERAPCELYRESDLVIRTIRDVFSADFAKIIVDDPRTADKVRDFLAIAMPRSSAPVELYGGHRPLFHEYKLEQEIERINSRYVPLPSGGSLVIESTEALVAIDVNSGKYREHDDAEETAYRINLEAAEEIARQLRLRDLGGLILCDLIDMRMEKHRRGVERALRDALKKHKERAKCLRMSQFGIIEMTRQRMRPSIKRSIYQDCPHCRGTGLVKNSESMTLDIMRLLRLATHHDQVDVVEVRVSPDVGFQLQNRKRAALHALERETGRHVVIRADENLGPDQYAFECLDQRGGVIRMDDLPDSARSLPEPRSKRRSGGGGYDPRPDNGRETLEDVFD